jgi:hypothetical protein
MKAHKYLKPWFVISAVPVPVNMMENPQFFTVTSPTIGKSTMIFPINAKKYDRKFYSNTGSTG